MSFEILFILFLLLAAFVLFATDYVSFDATAMILLISLLATGIALLVAGYLFLLLFGIKMIPSRRREEELTKDFEMQVSPGGEEPGSN